MTVANRDYTTTFAGKGAVLTWATADNDDTFTAASAPSVDKYTLQVTGTFDSATITLTGSLDGVTYSNITDAAGNAVALTAEGCRTFNFRALYVKPITSGGGGSTSLSVKLLAIPD